MLIVIDRSHTDLLILRHKPFESCPSLMSSYHLIIVALQPCRNHNGGNNHQMELSSAEDDGLSPSIIFGLLVRYEGTAKAGLLHQFMGDVIPFAFDELRNKAIWVICG